LGRNTIVSFYCLSLILGIILLPLLGNAIENDLENGIQKNLEQGKVIVTNIQIKLKSGSPISLEISQLKATAENIRITHLLLEERFKLREEKVKTFGAKALERHRGMVKGYHKALTEYLSLVDALTPNSRQSTVDNLKTLLDTLVLKKKKAIIGSLPYKHLNYPAQEPSTAPAITPAYKGGNKTVSQDDTKSTVEAPISKEIADLAQSLNWQPVAIYEYVKNNIETEWYWGCQKGAEETLRQKSGNDSDQATLLTALLRASGFPVRYVRGVIEFFPDLDRAKNLTGIDDPAKIAEFLQKAGIPFKPVIQGGVIANIQIEHVWVESQIPYANYRGAVIDENGKVWLGLDTSIKVKGYQQNQPRDIFELSAISGQLLAVRSEYLGLAQPDSVYTLPDPMTVTPLEYFKAKLSASSSKQDPQLTSDSYKLTRTLIPEILNILPASTQFTLIKATNEYTALPDNLVHKVKITATNPRLAFNNILLSVTVPLYQLSNRQVTINYEPETVEDQEIIHSYGGLGFTPAYLVRLRPALTINGQSIAIATDGLPMGSDFDLTVELISPNGSEKSTNSLIVGNMMALGIVAQKAVSAQHSDDNGELTAEDLIHREAIEYIDRWNKTEDELASLLHLTIARPVPTIVTLGGVIDVTYMLDIPHSFTWKGVYLDADVRRIETVQSAGFGVQSDREKLFMQISSLQGSVLEHRIFEDDWKTPAISTAKLLQLCAQGSELCNGIITIDKANIDAVIPTLPYDQSIKDDIINAVNQRQTVVIPHSEAIYLDWTGTGYRKENPETLESGWMLTGMIAGGMTAVSPAKWDNWRFNNILAAPYQNDYKTVIITDPKDGAILPVSSLAAIGYIIDPKAKVIVNGVTADVDGNIFTAMINLKQGMNKITAIATNAAGKQTSDTVIVKYSIPLKTFTTFPFDGAEVSVSPIFVEGMVSDPTATIKVNGILATVSRDGKFTASGISLTEGSNRITVAAVNQDNATDSQAITVNYKANQTPSPISISITYPAPNAAINKPMTMVVGTVTTTANEAWVKVNGVPAVIYGNQFVINNVPLIEGNNHIVADVMDSSGTVGRAEISVNANTTAPYVLLNTNITSGIAPLKAFFTASTTLPNPIISYQMDFDGDGVIDYTETTFDNIVHTYTEEGVFYPKLTITDNQGNAYTATIGIVVLYKEVIDTLLKSKWDGMKAKLANKDLLGSISYFGVDAKDKYLRVFQKLINNLPEITNNMQNIQVDYVMENVAEYRISRTENIDGQIKEITYFIYFKKDRNGQWKIEGL